MSSTIKTGYVEEVAAKLSRSPDTFQVRTAAEAYAARCPAYLDKHAGQHSSDKLANLVDYANTHGGLNGAQRALGINYIRADLLDNLVPLNLKAVKELSVIYADLGTFRMRDELLDRNPLFSLAEASVSTQATEAA